jgi:hypothetical protein
VLPATSRATQLHWFTAATVTFCCCLRICRTACCCCWWCCWRCIRPRGGDGVVLVDCLQRQAGVPCTRLAGAAQQAAEVRQAGLENCKLYMCTIEGVQMTRPHQQSRCLKFKQVAIHSYTVSRLLIIVHSRAALTWVPACSQSSSGWWAS